MKPKIGAGDKGTTALLFGRRVSKASPQPEAYGTVDELNSTLGLAKSFCSQEYSREVIDNIQKDLGIVAAELATEPERHEEPASTDWVVSEDMVKWLEGFIKEMRARSRCLPGSSIPGATTGAAAIDMARAIVRRAERRVVGSWKRATFRIRTCQRISTGPGRPVCSGTLRRGGQGG